MLEHNGNGPERGSPRSAALVGPQGAGKSTLFDALLAAALAGGLIAQRFALPQVAWVCAGLPWVVIGAAVFFVREDRVAWDWRAARAGFAGGGAAGCGTRRRAGGAGRLVAVVLRGRGRWRVGASGFGVRRAHI